MCASCNGFCQRVTGLLTLCHCTATTLHAVSFVSCNGVITADEPPDAALKGLATASKSLVTAVVQQQGVIILLQLARGW